MLNNKYRVHEVAKDFGKNSKDVADILTEYTTTPKNHMQVLEDKELSIVFDYLTQHNQVESVESIYADVYHEPKAAPQEQAGSKPQGKIRIRGRTVLSSPRTEDSRGLKARPDPRRAGLVRSNRVLPRDKSRYRLRPRIVSNLAAAYPRRRL